jgi:hypothetical protein
VNATLHCWLGLDVVLVQYIRFLLWEDVWCAGLLWRFGSLYFVVYVLSASPVCVSLGFRVK